MLFYSKILLAITVRRFKRFYWLPLPSGLVWCRSFHLAVFSVFLLRIRSKDAKNHANYCQKIN